MNINRIVLLLISIIPLFSMEIHKNPLKEYATIFDKTLEIIKEQKFEKKYELSSEITNFFSSEVFTNLILGELTLKKFFAKQNENYAEKLYTLLENLIEDQQNKNLFKIAFFSANDIDDFFKVLDLFFNITDIYNKNNAKNVIALHFAISLFFHILQDQNSPKSIYNYPQDLYPIFYRNLSVKDLINNVSENIKAIKKEFNYNYDSIESINNNIIELIKKYLGNFTYHSLNIFFGIEKIINSPEKDTTLYFNLYNKKIEEKIDKLTPQEEIFLKWAHKVIEKHVPLKIEAEKPNLLFSSGIIEKLKKDHKNRQELNKDDQNPLQKNDSVELSEKKDDIPLTKSKEPSQNNSQSLKKEKEKEKPNLDFTDVHELKPDNEAIENYKILLTALKKSLTQSYLTKKQKSKENNIFNSELEKKYPFLNLNNKNTISKLLSRQENIQNYLKKKQEEEENNKIIQKYFFPSYRINQPSASSIFNKIKSNAIKKPNPLGLNKLNIFGNPVKEIKNLKISRSDKLNLLGNQVKKIIGFY